MHIKECPIPERKIVTERRDAATRDKQSYLSADMHTCFLVPLIRNLLALVQALPRNVVEFNQTPITKNVTHPFDGDPSKLRINLGGIYNCSWILNTVAIAGTGGYYLSQGAFALQINDEVLPDRPQHYGDTHFLLKLIQMLFALNWLVRI